jgi:hypothetical protein
MRLSALTEFNRQTTAIRTSNSVESEWAFRVDGGERAVLQNCFSVMK